MSTSPLFGNPAPQWVDENGDPLVNGTVEIYLAATATPEATYTDSTGTTENPAVITLNALGEPPNEIWGTDGTAYKIIIKYSNGSVYRTISSITLGDAGARTLETNLADTSDATKGDDLIGFKQARAGTALTGAIAKTVHDKLEDYVNLFDFMTAAQIADVRAGTLLVDVTAAIQACIDAVVAAPLINPRIYAPDGHYRLESGLTLGLTSGARTSGFVFSGAGPKSTEFVWYGGNTGTMFDCPALWHGHLSDFRIRGDATGGIPDIGMLIDGGNGASGAAHILSNVDINNAGTGLYIGSTTAANDSVPSGSYFNLTVGNCSVAGIRIYGNDTDGQHFYNLISESNAINIWGTGCRTVHVIGGVHTNHTGVGDDYSDFVYMQLDGPPVLGSGAYSLENLRIEGGVTLLNVGVISGTGNSEDEHVYFKAENVYYASIPADISTKPRIMHCGQSGSYVFENCHFPAPGSFFDFYNIARTNRFAGLWLRGCSFSEDTADVEVFGNLINVNGNGGGGTTGGLRAYFEGNVINDNDVSIAFSVAAMRDRKIAVLPDDADNEVKNISGATQANPCVITTTASHGYATGDVIEVIEIVGMTELNNRPYTITVLTGTTFELDGENSTGYTAYSSAGQTTKPRFRLLRNTEVVTGLTAYATGGQANATELTAEVNEISTVATTADSVKVPFAYQGLKVTIRNNGANACDVFPQSGDNLGAGVDTAVSLAASASITYVAYDSTNWVSY